MSTMYYNSRKYAGLNLGVYQKRESVYVTQSGTTTTVPIGISGYRSTDILLVDINGLNLIEGTDYTISGTNIVLTEPITIAGEPIHFVSLRVGSVNPVDLNSLKGDKGEPGEPGLGLCQKTEGIYTTTVVNESVIPISASGYRSIDALFVDINGLELIQGVDYTIDDTDIILTTPIKVVGTPVHFMALRMAQVPTEDYSNLRGNDGKIEIVRW